MWPQYCPLVMCRSLFSNGVPPGISLVRTLPHVSPAPALRTVVAPAPATSHVTRVSHPAASHVTHVSHAPATVLRTPALATHHLSHAPVTVSAPAPAVESVRVVAPAPAPVVLEEELVPANYNFGYSVSDLVSGDSKTRQESREGDVVTGSYSVADPDGRVRTVTYTADSEHGFQAKVTYDGEEGPVAIPFHPPTSPALAPLAPALAPAAPAPAPAAEVADEAESVIAAKEAEPAAASSEVADSTRAAPATAAVTQAVPHTIFPSFIPRAVPAVPHLAHVSAVPHVSHVAAVPHVSHAVPVVNTRLGQLDLGTLLRLLNTPAVATHATHAAHAAPVHAGAVRTSSGAPVDLSQFTFLSGGQVLV